MTKTNSDGQRIPWTTPTLKRIVAGSAENQKATGIADGAVTGNTKS
jgi:hypothetical protein